MPSCPSALLSDTSHPCVLHHHIRQPSLWSSSFPSRLAALSSASLVQFIHVPSSARVQTISASFYFIFKPAPSLMCSFLILGHPRHSWWKSQHLSTLLPAALPSVQTIHLSRTRYRLAGLPFHSGCYNSRHHALTISCADHET